MKTAYFAGGCFWCITPVYKIQKGVLAVTAGYQGGDEADPTYEQVKHQETHHRETIKVDYDPERISFASLLDIFLLNIDPFDAGGQFIDRGASYTAAVYYNDEDERRVTLEKLAALEQQSGKKTAVAVEPAKPFYPAEEYHQDYYLKNPEAFERELRESGRKNPSADRVLRS